MIRLQPYIGDGGGSGSDVYVDVVLLQWFVCLIFDLDVIFSSIEFM